VIKVFVLWIERVVYSEVFCPGDIEVAGDVDVAVSALIAGVGDDYQAFESRSSASGCAIDPASGDRNDALATGSAWAASRAAIRS